MPAPIAAIADSWPKTAEPTPLVWFKFEDDLTNSGSYGGTASVATGSISYGTGFGGTGKAATFNGSTRVARTGSTSLTGHAAFSVTADFKSSSYSEDPVTIAGIYNAFVVELRFGGIRIEIWTGSGYTAYSFNTANPGYCDGSWHSLKVTYESGSLKTYIDGSLINTQTGNTGSLASTNGDFCMGDLGFNNMFYTGSIDNVKLFSAIV